MLWVGVGMGMGVGMERGLTEGGGGDGWWDWVGGGGGGWWVAVVGPRLGIGVGGTLVALSITSLNGFVALNLFILAI